MRYRVFKERRLFRPYKVQVWADMGAWTDCVSILRYHDEVVVRTKYYWTVKTAVKEIEKDCSRGSLYE